MVKFSGISSFLTGSVGNVNGLLGINRPLGNPAAPVKLDGKPAVAKLDVNDATDKLVGNPIAMLVARLEGKAADKAGGKLVGRDVGSPGLDTAGIGNLGIAGPPGMPGAPDNGDIPPVNSCPTAAAA